ncbi:hypothetical protein ACFQS1_11250 [Paractinoplanes rhizophilus]|uniref:Knr4/Smi1-like domain-containing protein n=1 Tax=Paractinoplanes rhizophilus TaxID=1416877 RepID=A0ABW2HS38_9ACTN
MDTQFDLHAELAPGLPDAAGAWRFIRLFAANYARPIVGSDGYDDAQLREAEQRLGFPLPASMRAAYGLMGKRSDLTRGQDDLLTPHQLKIDDTGRMLVFRVEAQGCTKWGVPLSAVDEPDPPVSYSGASDWHPFLERFSLACVEMVLSEWIAGGAPYGINCQLEDDTIAMMEQRLRRLPLPDYPAWWWPSGGPVRWFEKAGAILLEHPGTWLWAGAASPDGLATVRQTLPGDWSDSYE